MGPGFPGTQNDKTIARTDKMIQAAKNDPLFTEYMFKLHALNGDIVRCQGAYGIVDGGYHRWRSLQCAFKHAVLRTLAWAWSRWFGSTRKDAECLFGSLKRRFRILRDPLPFQYAQDCHNVMWMCCVFHNILLRHDGKDKFSKSVPTPDLEAEDLLVFDANNSLDGIDSDAAESGSDSDGEPRQNQLLSQRDNPDMLVDNEVHEEMEKGWEQLRGQLIEHFHYCRTNKILKWKF